MSTRDLPQRLAISARVRSAKERLAREVNSEFFQRHPDWREHYGERGVRLGFEDACFHLDFLAAALEAGEVASFSEYAIWARRMLEARGIAVAFLTENLQQVGRAAASAVEQSDQDYLLSFVVEAVAACNQPLPASAGPEAAVRVFVQSLVAGNRQAAVNIARESLSGGCPVRHIYLHLLQPAMYEVGRLWETNQITVAREHMATAITQYVMAQLFPLLGKENATPRGTVIVTGIEGELHQIGALMVADVLESDGWQVRFLGTHMPHSGILEALESEQASVLGISTTMLFNVPKAVQLIQLVRAHIPGLTIVVGGAAFKSARGLWKECGAHAFAPDLEGAISILRDLRKPAVA